MTYFEYRHDMEWEDHFVSNDLEVMPEVSIEAIRLDGYFSSNKLRPIATQNNNGFTPLDRASQLLSVADDVLNLATKNGTDLYRVTIPEGCNLARSAVDNTALRGVAVNAKGKLNGNVSLAKVSPSPAQIATIGLSAAAIVVGQAYMTEISNSLKDIDRKLDKIASMIENQQWSKVQNAIQAASRYVGSYQSGMMTKDSMAMQAAYNQLSHLYDDVSEVMIWVTKGLDSIVRELKSIESKEKYMQEIIDDLYQYEELFQLSGRALFALAAAKMFFEDSITRDRALHEEKEIRLLAEGFIQKRDIINALLEVQIPSIKGFSSCLTQRIRK